MTQRPSIPKSAALMFAGGGACIGLANLPAGPAHPSSAAPRIVIDWWSSAGTGPAAMSLVWLIAVGMAAYATAMGAIALAAALAHVTGHIRPLGHAWASIGGDRFKRLLAVGAIVASSSGPTIASAQTTPPAPLVLMDLGPAVGTTNDTIPGTSMATSTMPASATPADTTPTGEVAPEGIAPAASIGISTIADTADLSPIDNVWTVKPGDHLWHIAEQTLRSATGTKPSVRQITRYWKRLIKENLATVGSNPDLIMPGQSVILPPL